jgi:hypothetical protein
MRAPMRLILLWSATLILNCLSAPCGIAQTDSPERLARQTPEAMPHSGALLGLSGGQTLWIASADDKIRVLAAPDYIIPRKDGFWRVRLDVKWVWAPPEESPAEAIIEAVKNDPALSGVPPGYGRLWAVRLKKGMDAVARSPEQPMTAAQAEDNQEENQMGEGQAQEEVHQQRLLFLSPDYLSFYEEHTSGGRIRETERILNVTDPPGAPVRAREQLLVHEASAPISNSTRDKDLIACIDPDGKEGFQEEDFLRSGIIGIRRKNQKWVYDSVEGNEDTVFAACAVSVLPPKRIVGSNELFPEWKQIKSTYPDAEDAFSSPSHDLLLVTGNSHLIIVPVYDGKIGKQLADIELFDQPVMVQWAIGKYVDAWTNELAPYFHAYAPREVGLDPKVENEEGLKFMQRRQPMSAVGWFVGAARTDSSNAEYTNNAGFAYYQMGKYGESVLWLEKTISIDPKRAVAYLNLGDAYAKLKRNGKARQAYTKYLELAPDSKSTAQVKKKLDALSQ